LHFKHTLTIVSTLVICLSVLPFSGCSTGLRFAPSDAQKQIAFDAHIKARAANLNGAVPQSDLTRKLVDETEASLQYIGMPASPRIDDYDAAIAQAKADAVKRPDPNDVFSAADAGLSLAAQLAIALGLGGTGVGGKKLLDWIALARQKGRAFEEIVKGNELLKRYLTDMNDTAALDAFKKSQSAVQEGTTPELVAVSRVTAKDDYRLIAPPAMLKVDPPKADTDS